MTDSLEQMVARWKQVAQHAATYDLTLDDWLNDLDLRDLIDRNMSNQVGPVARVMVDLDSADRAFRESTAESRDSLWGTSAGAKHDHERQWWYFRYPKFPRGTMRSDLEHAGIIARDRTSPPGKR